MQFQNGFCTSIFSVCFYLLKKKVETKYFFIHLNQKKKKTNLGNNYGIFIKTGISLFKRVINVYLPNKNIKKKKKNISSGFNIIVLLKLAKQALLVARWVC